jgi:glycine/D-amino acid oxidase-like deaminating enzyme
MPAQAYEADAVIVGAGLAGLVATAELASAGHRVLLLDREPAPSLGGLQTGLCGRVLGADGEPVTGSPVSAAPTRLRRSPRSSRCKESCNRVPPWCRRSKHLDAHAVVRRAESAVRRTAERGARVVGASPVVVRR